MEIVPEVVHQRVPVIMGSKNEIEEVIEAYAEAAKAEEKVEEKELVGTNGAN